MNYVKITGDAKWNNFAQELYFAIKMFIQNVADKKKAS